MLKIESASDMKKSDRMKVLMNTTLIKEFKRNLGVFTNEVK
jgi:hypothetical protein